MGTTAQKLNYAIQSTNEIADRINYLGGNITSETELADFKSELDTIYENETKVTGEGTNIILEHTKKGRIDTIMYGQIGQDGTPTTDNEIPVKCVTGNNTVRVRGKNLFDKNNANILNNTLLNGINGTISSFNGTKTLYLPIKPSTTYTVSKIVSARFIVGTCSNTPAANVVCNVYNTNNTGTSITITSGSSDKYLCVFYYLSGTDTVTEQQILDSIQIEESSENQTEPSEYEPYYEPQEKELDLGELELYENGYISKENGKWYLNNEWGKIASYNGGTITTDYYSTTGQLTTGATVVYKLSTPSKTEITDPTLINQLNDIYKLMSINGTTIIETECESGNLPIIINAKALSSLNVPIDDKVHIYGVKRKITNNSNTEWERMLDSEGKIANATKDGSPVINDFDELYPWSEIKTCNYNLTTGQINAWFGDATFKFDGTNGDVFTYIPKTYWKIYQENDYDYVLLADSPKEGFIEINDFYIGRYNCTDNSGVLHTYSGSVPTTSRTVTAFRNSANALGSKFSQLDWRYFVLQMLYLVEYANYDSQSKLGNGIMSRNLVNTLIAENGTNRVVVPNNTNFYIGQIIRIGTSVNGGQVAYDRKITAVEEYDDGTVTGTSLTFSGASANIAVGNYVSTCAQETGQCDILGMKSGCLNNDGYHSVIYRGMENIYGDVFQFVDGINIRDSQVYICKNHSQYQTDLFELPYKPLSYINYSTSNGWTKTLGFDIDEPFFRFPTEMGGSSSTYLCDYYVKGTGSVNFRMGGCSSDGQKNGFWSFYTSGSTAGASWDRGCRILIDS